jgi:hypothetical protein
MSTGWTVPLKPAGAEDGFVARFLAVSQGCAEADEIVTDFVHLRFINRDRALVQRRGARPAGLLRHRRGQTQQGHQDNQGDSMLCVHGPFLLFRFSAVRRARTFGTLQDQYAAKGLNAV